MRGPEGEASGERQETRIGKGRGPVRDTTIALGGEVHRGHLDRARWTAGLL